MKDTKGGKAFMVGVGIVLVLFLGIWFCYSMVLSAKRADENLLIMYTKVQKMKKENKESYKETLKIS